MWKPLETGWIDDLVFAIRDKDVNCFLIRTDRGYLAIDSGYKNSANVRAALQRNSIDPESVKAVFLTHLDIDHAGGVDINSDVVFPKAQIYLSQEERKYESGEYVRKKVLHHSCKLPLALPESAISLGFGEKRELQGVAIETVAATGHTLGHTAYLVNNTYLFTGDCLVAGKDGGYCFYDFWNADSAQNVQSLESLKAFCNERNISEVITSHTGIVKTECAFLHYRTSPQWRDKGFSFIDDAEDDPYCQQDQA